MNCNCVLVLVGSNDCRKRFPWPPSFCVPSMPWRREKIPDSSGQRASECSSVWQNGTKGGAQNSQTECLLPASSPASRVSLRYNCASRTRMAVAEDVRRRSRRRLCQTNRRTMRTLTSLSSDVTQTNQRKREGGRDKKGDRIHQRHFIRERNGSGYRACFSKHRAFSCIDCWAGGSGHETVPIIQPIIQQYGHGWNHGSAKTGYGGGHNI